MKTCCFRPFAETPDAVILLGRTVSLWKSSGLLFDYGSISFHCVGNQEICLGVLVRKKTHIYTKESNLTSLPKNNFCDTYIHEEFTSQMWVKDLTTGHVRPGLR